MRILLRVYWCFVLLSGCAPSNRVHWDSNEFHQFIDAQQQAAFTPEVIQRGKQVFLQGPCAMCHTIRGTQALSRVGPDLTHLGTRKMLAAGIMPNTRGHLAGWILNPQNLKPGTRMPATILSSRDLHALLSYLETLK